MNQKTIIQTSESLAVGSILALAGGFMDAYSYLCRGGVFANAETGNLVLLAINLASFEWKRALLYLVPVLAFAAGVLISAVTKAKKETIRAIHWRQITVIIESCLLALVAFLPAELNLVANSAISLACGIQVTAFAKFHSNAIATTMCTGNLRSGMQNLQQYMVTKDKATLRKSLLYFGCIAWFLAGAMLGVWVIGLLGMKAILTVSVGLWVVIVLMISEDREEHAL